jgi:hypothetical protein
MLNRSTDFVGKMDPFAVVEYTRAGQAARRFRSQTHTGGHKAPKWDWEMTYTLSQLTSPLVGDTVRIAVMEEDMGSAADKVGESAVFKLSDIAAAVMG